MNNERVPMVLPDGETIEYVRPHQVESREDIGWVRKQVSQPKPKPKPKDEE
jgi:hypothetical protein